MSAVWLRLAKIKTSEGSPTTQLSHYRQKSNGLKIYVSWKTFCVSYIDVALKAL